MLKDSNQQSHHVTDLLNGTISSIKNVVPLPLTLNKALQSEKTIHLQFAVLIGITGDIKGKMVLNGEPEVFGSIGEVMFGMSLEGEMLSSFSGELGNMIAGGVSTNVMEKGIHTDITAPTVLQGDTTLTGHEKALQVPVSFENAGSMNIYLLLD